MPMGTSFMAGRYWRPSLGRAGLIWAEPIQYTVSSRKDGDINEYQLDMDMTDMIYSLGLAFQIGYDPL